MDAVYLFLQLHYLNIVTDSGTQAKYFFKKINKTKPHQNIGEGSFIMTVLDFTFIVANLTDALFMLVDIYS